MRRIGMLILLLLAACAPAQPHPTLTPSLAPTFTLLPPQPTAIPPTRAATQTPLPRPTRSPTPLPTKTAPPTPTRVYPPAFGIDYAHPETYRAQGEQTRLAKPAVADALRGRAPSLAHLGEIYAWVRKNFSTWSAGGKTIGVVTSEQLLAERRLGGCHDWALVFTSLARELGYPVVMVDTASIAWAGQFQSGQKGAYSGHVFVEVYVSGRWVLIDPTNNHYVDQGYDPANPVIPLKGNIAGSTPETYGFYVMRKGVDTWGYAIRSTAELNRLMEDTARSLKIGELRYPAYPWGAW